MDCSVKVVVTAKDILPGTKAFGTQREIRLAQTNNAEGK